MDMDHHTAMPVRVAIGLEYAIVNHKTTNNRFFINVNFCESKPNKFENDKIANLIHFHLPVD